MVSERPECSEVVAPGHGTMQSEGVSVGSEVVFECNEGYRMVGQDTIRCLPDGNGGAEWSGSPPVCQGRYRFSIIMI